MRWIAYLLIGLLLACKNDVREVSADPESTTVSDTGSVVAPEIDDKTEEFSNARFKNVIAEQTAPGMFRIKGQAQIFEANFSWVVEDGHNELANGHQTTDAGAPEWGNFDFSIDVGKDRENSTLTLILFEISANDGSRQYELPIPLPD